MYYNENMNDEWRDIKTDQTIYWSHSDILAKIKFEQLTSKKIPDKITRE